MMSPLSDQPKYSSGKAFFLFKEIVFWRLKKKTLRISSSVPVTEKGRLVVDF